MSATTTEAYLELLPADQRAALVKVQKQIKAAAPKAEPHFGYGLPGFSLNGHPFIYFGAAKSHCAIYGNNEATITAKLAGYKHSKGAIQFTPDKPLPPALIKEIVQIRAAANQAKWGDAATPKSKAKASPAPRATTKKKVAAKATTKPKAGTTKQRSSAKP